MTEEKKKWWQYKKMGSRELGITALVLILLGIFQFFDKGNGSLIGVGMVFAIAWIYVKGKSRNKIQG